MFHDPAAFPSLAPLAARWRDVLAEYRALAAGAFEAWPERRLCERGWTTFGLHAFGAKRPEACALCPVTAALVEAIPGMVMAGFSRLAPGAHILPHRGYEGWSPYVIRCHLGLATNEGCALRVGAETRPWREGELLMFGDHEEHEAWNRGATERAVLLVDVRHPDYPDRVLCPGLTPELRAFLDVINPGR